MAATIKEMDIPLRSISPHPRQPRLNFDREAILRLAESLKDPNIGLLQRIVVRPKGGKRYELLAGERRVRAAKEAGWKTIPATVRFVDDRTSLRILLIENLERIDLNPLERAFALSELQRPLDDGGAAMSVAEIATAFSRSEKWVQETIRFLDLKEPWRSRLASGEIDESKAEILTHCEPAVQRAIDQAIETNPEAWRTRELWRANVAAIKSRVDGSHTARPSNAKQQQHAASPSRPKTKRTSKPMQVVLDRTLTDADVRDILRPFAAQRGDLLAIRNTAQQMIDRLEQRKAKAG